MSILFFFKSVFVYDASTKSGKISATKSQKTKEDDVRKSCAHHTSLIYETLPHRLFGSTSRNQLKHLENKPSPKTTTKHKQQSTVRIFHTEVK